MLANRAQHDDTYPRIFVKRFEHEAQLVALRHLDDVERRPVENHVGALALGIDIDAKAVELCEACVGKRHGSAHAKFLDASSYCVGCGGVALGPVFTGHELAAQKLADRRLGNLRYENIAARALEIGQAELRQKASSSPASTAARRLTKAQTTLPQRSSGKPATATSDTAGCSDKQLSISTGETFSPPLMIISSTRPVTKRSPSASINAGVAGKIPAAANGGGIGVGATPVAFERFIAGD